LVETAANREGALDDEGIFGFFSGNKIADQTEKIHAVRKAVKQGADEAQQRASALRSMHQAMNERTRSKQVGPKGVIAPVREEMQQSSSSAFSVGDPYAGVAAVAKGIAKQGVLSTPSKEQGKKSTKKSSASRKLLSEMSVVPASPFTPVWESFVRAGDDRVLRGAELRRERQRRPRQIVSQEVFRKMVRESRPVNNQMPSQEAYRLMVREGRPLSQVANEQARVDASGARVRGGAGAEQDRVRPVETFASKQAFPLRMQRRLLW
jgi:hypothetical protein